MNKNTDADFDLPKQISINYYEDYMHLCYSWRGRGLVIGTIFTVFWVFMVSMLYYQNFEAVNSKSGLVVFALIFAVSTAFIVYYTVAHWFNKTDIFVNKDVMEMKIGPIPWYGNLRIKTNNITQFYNKKRVKGSKEKRRVSFEVHYILQDQSDKKLLTGLATREQVQYIEQKIEQYLGIKNDTSINKDDYDYLA